MRIRIEGTDLPGSTCGPSPQRPEGHRNIHVGVQRRGKPAELGNPTCASVGPPLISWSAEPA